MEQFVIHKRFFDFDEFSYTVNAWDLDFLQLDAGECDVDMVQFACGNCLLSNAKFNRHYEQRGSTPSGKWTFVIFSEQTPPIIWREKEIANTTLITFKPGSEVDCVSRPGFENFTISYSEEYLNEICANLGLPEMKKLTNDYDNFDCCPLMLSDSRRQMLRIIEVIKQNPSQAKNASLKHTLEVQLPEQILLTLGKSLPLIPASFNLRNQAMKLSKGFLAEFPQKLLSVSDLCKITRVSERSLQYAFKEHFGITPQAYLKIFRLNGVRRELRRSVPSTTKVNHVAIRWNFWHMGKFAADYRKLFGELPSKTLRRQSWFY